MGKVNILLTKANGNLSDEEDVVKKAVKVAEEYVFPRFKVDWDIDLLVTNRLYESSSPKMELAVVHELAILSNLRYARKKQLKILFPR